MRRLSFETTCIAVKSARLPEAFNGFTLVHLSDLHNASFGDGQKPLLEEICRQQPDVIVVTGDLIDSEKYFHALTLIRGAADIAPVFYATGNHEAHTDGYPRLETEMAACGAQILRNTYVKLTRQNSTILLAGADDPSFTPHRKTAVVMSENLQSIQLDYDFFTILLSHRPDLIKVYAAFGFDVVLCGHAHGGHSPRPGADRAESGPLSPLYRGTAPDGPHANGDQPRSGRPSASGKGQQPPRADLPQALYPSNRHGLNAPLFVLNSSGVPEQLAEKARIYPGFSLLFSFLQPSLAVCLKAHSGIQTAEPHVCCCSGIKIPLV